MSGLSKMFTNEELEEIEVFRDGTIAMSVDGKDIICFELLHKLINDGVEISTIEKEELLIAYAQLKGFKEISNSIGIFDTSLLETIVQKSKKRITDELEARGM